MRILVNSKYIASAFKQALDNKCEKVSLFETDLCFRHGLSDDLSYNVHVLQSSDAIDLDILTLYKAYKFISALEEQPIVVDIFYDQIEVSQFVKRFQNDKV